MRHTLKVREAKLETATCGAFAKHTVICNHNVIITQGYLRSVYMLHCAVFAVFETIKEGSSQSSSPVKTSQSLVSRKSRKFKSRWDLRPSFCYLMLGSDHMMLNKYSQTWQRVLEVKVDRKHYKRLFYPIWFIIHWYLIKTKRLVCKKLLWIPRQI